MSTPHALPPGQSPPASDVYPPPSPETLPPISPHLSVFRRSEATLAYRASPQAEGPLQERGPYGFSMTEERPASYEGRGVLNDTPFQQRAGQSGEAEPSPLLDALAWPDYRAEAPPKWTPLHDLAIVFLSLAYDTDGDLSDAEVEMMLNCMERWVQESSESFLFVVMQESMHHYECGEREGLVTAAITGLNRVLTGAQRRALAVDLHAVATANGVTVRPEREALARVRQALRLEEKG